MKPVGTYNKMYTTMRHKKIMKLWQRNALQEFFCWDINKVGFLDPPPHPHDFLMNHSVFKFRCINFKIPKLYRMLSVRFTIQTRPKTDCIHNFIRLKRSKVYRWIHIYSYDFHWDVYTKFKMHPEATLRKLILCLYEFFSSWIKKKYAQSVDLSALTHNLIHDQVGVWEPEFALNSTRMTGA